MGTHTAAAGAATPQTATDGHLTGFGSRPYRSYVLSALLLIYVLNFLDRGLLGVLSEPIITDLKINDFQFGLLTGPAFAIFYSLIGVPLAFMSETRSRVWIMAICVALWSAATTLSGFAYPVIIGDMAISGFVVMLVFRMLVGIGEAGCTPPANSLIADYYPPARRSTAIGYYAMGVTMGTLSANLIGGPVAAVFTSMYGESIGWRAAFMLIGAIGIVLAVVFKLTVKEPPRGYSDPPGSARPGKATFTEAVQELLKKPSFWTMSMGAMLAAFCGYGIVSFQTSFIRRVHEVSQLEATVLFNIPSAFAASVGVFFTGWLAEKMIKRHPNAIAWLPAAGLLICVPFYLVAFSSDNKWVCLVGICIGASVKYGYIAAQYTIGQGVVGVRTRATATAILLLIINLLGNGVGPLITGFLSDMFFQMQVDAAGLGDLARTSCRGAGLQALSQPLKDLCAVADPKALQNSLLVLATLYALPALFFFLTMRTLQKDLVAK